MKKYKISVPIAGYAIIEVEAESEQEAKNIATYEKVHINRIHWKKHPTITTNNILLPQKVEIIDQ